jgi:two-component system, OmpR family, sensor histidine kinase CpxA
MNSLFFKVFIWFWLTTLVMMSVIFVAGRIDRLVPPEPPGLFAAVAPSLASEAMHAYQSGGSAAFVQYIRRFEDSPGAELYLLDNSSKDVLSRRVPPDILRLARTTKDAIPELRRYSLHMSVGTYRFFSSSGHPYVLVLCFYVPGRVFPGRFWSSGRVVGHGRSLLGILLVVLTLFCLLLAHHIASPVRDIRSATQRFAQGDLNARVPSSVSKRHDELAALASDFDSMVERIGSLIRVQRDLLNSVSHELRSPLARLNVSLALLQNQASTRSEDLLQRMERDVDKIDALMAQLLTLSRLESGLSSGGRSHCDLALLVQEVAADGDFEAQALNKAVRYSLPTPSSLRTPTPLH